MGSETPMSCQQAFEDDRAGRYVAAELSDAERDAFEIHVLECPACRAALEAHLDVVEALRARRPAEAVAPTPLVPRAAVARSPRWSGLALAASVVFAAFGWFGGRYSATQRFETERESLRGSTRRLEEELGRTQAEQERLRAEMERVRGEAPAVASTAPSPAAGRVLSFALSPGVERGDGAGTSLSIPEVAGEVRFELDLATVRSYPGFRAELRGPDGDVVWSESRLRAQGGEGERFLVARVPAAVLRRGHHELLLRGVTASGATEDAAVYDFSLRRR